MIRPAYVLAIFFYLAVTTAAQAQASEPARMERTKDGHSVVLLTVPLYEGSDLHATFDFGKTKGFLGSSSNPDQDSFVNADGTIIAINHIPATKSSGQVRELLDIFGWALSFDGCASRPTEASYSSSSSFLTA